jgi:hypothetical protein
MPKWLQFIIQIIPVFGDWLIAVFNTNNQEFEKISDAWPYPTRMRLAKLRAEHRAREHFGVSEDIDPPMPDDASEGDGD